METRHPIDKDGSMDDFYRNLMDKDNITDSWLLFGSPYPVSLALGLYLALVWGGPRAMRGRAPYRLDGLMRLYNLVQVVYNASLVYSVFTCPGVIDAVISISVSSTEGNYEDLKPAYLLLSWHYIVLKILDLIDTAFLILMKKDSHVSVLHVYHHGGMVLFGWVTFKFTKAPHAVVPGVINLFVHAMMYSYFFLATFPALKPYLWWKKLLTKLQLAQFVVILLYISLLYFNGYPMSRMFAYIWLSNVFVVFVLFVNFYIKAYVMKPKIDSGKRE